MNKPTETDIKAETTSTGGLVFLFIPLYQPIPAVVLLVLLFFLRRPGVNRNS